MTDSLHIVCPHCHTTNRISRENLSHAPHCGSCHKPLFEAHPVLLNEANFDRHISRNQIAVLVDFWAEWCGPCKMIGPIVDEMATTFEGRVKVVKINIDQNPGVPRKYAVRGIPTLMMFKNGVVASTQVGAVGKAQLNQFVEKAL